MKKEKTIKILTIAILAVSLIALANQVTLVEAQTCVPLRITYWNLLILSYLPDWAYKDGKLSWFFGQLLDATYERDWYGYTQHADNFGYYWGQCVSSVKALSKNNIPTGQDNPTLKLRWYKGWRVVDGGVSTGTVIATFFGYGGTYKGHAAIFKGYVTDSFGRIIGIEVWDQNWYSVNGMGVFGKHRIYRNGSGVLNADNYYVVIVPT